MNTGEFKLARKKIKLLPSNRENKKIYTVQLILQLDLEHAVEGEKKNAPE